MGIGSSGLIMAGEALQHCGFFQPMFIKLGRQFDEIARHIGAGEAREAHTAEQAVQRMAHFMEQGHRVVKRQQAGIAFAEVGIVDDDGQNFALKLLLLAEAGHPGTALLARPGEIIAIEKPDYLAFAQTSHTRTSG